MDYWDWNAVALPGWLAVLGGMCLGAFLYGVGFREGMRDRDAADKPDGEPEIGGDDGF